MLVFIDESGDTGFKFDKGSSRYFVIVAVIFDDHDEVNRVDRIITNFKHSIGFQDNVEFKFNKSSHQTRVEFLRMIKDSKFVIHSLIIDKKRINNKHLVYTDIVKSLLNSNGIINAKIKIDGNGSGMFKKKFKSTLRQSLNISKEKIIRDITFVDSKNNTLIQLADMLAGSIRKSYEGDGETKNIIKKHIIVEHVLP